MPHVIKASCHPDFDGISHEQTLVSIRKVEFADAKQTKLLLLNLLLQGFLLVGLDESVARPNVLLLQVLELLREYQGEDLEKEHLIESAHTCAVLLPGRILAALSPSSVSP